MGSVGDIIIIIMVEVRGGCVRGGRNLELGLGGCLLMVLVLVVLSGWGLGLGADY